MPSVILMLMLAADDGAYTLLRLRHARDAPRRARQAVREHQGRAARRPAARVRGLQLAVLLRGVRLRSPPFLRCQVLITMAAQGAVRDPAHVPAGAQHPEERRRGHVDHAHERGRPAHNVANAPGLEHLAAHAGTALQPYALNPSPLLISTQANAPAQHATGPTRTRSAPRASSRPTGRATRSCRSARARARASGAASARRRASPRSRCSCCATASRCATSRASRARPGRRASSASRAAGRGSP